LHSLTDERVKDLFLLKSPWPVVGILAAYLYFVNGRGQNWMKDRKPFELNSIINVYNIVQIFLNLYMGVGVRHGLSFSALKKVIFIQYFRFLSRHKGFISDVRDGKLQRLLYPSSLE
jgi:GNS1/SUR4 family